MGLLAVLGAIALLMIILALTSAPFWIWYNLGVKKAGVHRPPDFIILMGGGGMPSESGLIRCWYAAKAADHFTRSKVIIALPGNPADSLSSVNQMKRELVLRGVAPERIFFEDSGTNTRAQAINIWKQVKGYALKSNRNYAIPPFSMLHSQCSILIVTSPEHLYRAVLAFQKAGFLKTDGIPAFEEDIEGDLSFIAKKLGGRKFIPDIGENITLRYQFWTQLHYETLIIREWLALGYYKLKGWI